MNKKSLNDSAWEKLFEKYSILDEIDKKGSFEISAEQIKEFREPRLMAKFDHTVNLPEIFLKNSLSILPVTRGDYIISHFKAYHKFEDDNASVEKLPLPDYIQSLDYNNISSETMALNCAFVSGMIEDFLNDTELVPTVSGRMGSGIFNFNIENSADKSLCSITVNNSQIEIDAAYEGIKSLALFEAKRDLSDDFLVRQLYYPYRTWQSRILKPVRPLFLVYSNGIYRLYEYTFASPDNYSSICLVRQKNYSVEDTTITIADIEKILRSTVTVNEPEVPFPQADSFERVINLCELLKEHNLNKKQVTEKYDFDQRQTNYYTDAGRYLGLIDKICGKESSEYTLNDIGKSVLNLGFKQRQLEFCKRILSHKPFYEILKQHLITGAMPSKAEIVRYMKKSDLYRVKSDETYERRASTVKHWVNWIIGLVNE